MNIGKPNPEQARSNYRALAPGYDASCERISDIRAEAVGLLGLREGHVVLDVASGTGLSYGLLRTDVGASGAVVGLELSPEMCALARKRTRDAGWTNVTTLESDALEAGLADWRFDALLFHYTHDVLRQPEALARLFAQARPGARVVVAGLKRAPTWAAPATAIAMWRARKYLTTYEGLDAPWSHLLAWVPGFRWQARLMGTGYIGWGNAMVAGSNA